jgi:hypothetical protein
MDELRDLKHYYEQEGYNEIRSALQEDFLIDPTAFVTHFGKRPEDLSGVELREFYPHFLVQQRIVRSKHEGFKKRFSSGNLFGGIIALSEMSGMAMSGQQELCGA